MGGKLGTLFARAGHEVVFSYARGEQKLARRARQAQGRTRGVRRLRRRTMPRRCCWLCTGRGSMMC